MIPELGLASAVFGTSFAAVARGLSMPLLTGWKYLSLRNNYRAETRSGRSPSRRVG
jgi:hypothetical protein